MDGLSTEGAGNLICNKLRYRTVHAFLPQKTILRTMNTLRSLFFGSLISIASGVCAQAGSVDLTFNPTDAGYGLGNGANNFVRASALQPDGKVIIGGNFTTYNGTNRNDIARLHADGSLDVDFAVGTGFNSVVSVIALQPDGKVLVGGNFTTFNGTSCVRIARLNADGTLDTGFNSGTGPSTSVFAIAVQTDGKILIGGNFTTFNGTARARMARLNADGTLDATFDPGVGPNNQVEAILVQPNGKILVGGLFTTFNGGNKRGIVRLESNGALDTGGFNSGVGTTGGVFAMVLQSDGRIFIAGSFTFYNATARNRVARLLATGAIDATFDPGTGASGTVETAGILSDGRFVIGGELSFYNGFARKFTAIVLANGTLDTSFDPLYGSDNYVYTLVVQADNKIIIGGAFPSYRSVVRNYIARVGTDGALDESFNTPSAITGGTANCLVVQPDDKLIVGGNYTSYAGYAKNKCIRLDPDGDPDAGFYLVPGVFGNIFSVALQPDGKILKGGPSLITRLNADGTNDTGFSGGSPNNTVSAITLQADGKILVGGYFTTYKDSALPRLVRVLADGTLDPGFNIGTGPAFNGGMSNPVVEEIKMLPDGRILVRGSFNRFNGVVCDGFICLDTDGSIDTDFASGNAGQIGALNGITVLTDGRVMVCGSFFSCLGVPRRCIARLNADGTLDTSFDPGTGTGSSASNIKALVEQPDGKYIIVGFFSMYNGTAVNKIARLNASGSLDTSFNTGTGPDQQILDVALQSDGRVIIVGQFTSFNGIGRNRIARLNTDPPVTDIQVAARCILEGPYKASTGLMNDNLRTLDLLPATEPYTALGYAHVGGGAESTSPAVLAIAGNDAVVDWVVLELRDEVDPSIIVASRCALLQRDGDVVDVDGTSAVSFSMSSGNYHIAMRHRTHLGTMTLGSVSVTTTPVLVDLSSTSTATFGSNARKSITGAFPTEALWAGDASFDHLLRYAGTNNDRDLILTRIGGVIPTNSVSGYHPEDVNLDGAVKYAGEGNDRDLILQNIGGVIPTNSRMEQLPTP